MSSCHFKLEEVNECYNITFHAFTTMISRIMLHKIRFFSQHYPLPFGAQPHKMLTLRLSLRLNHSGLSRQPLLTG